MEGGSPLAIRARWTLPMYYAQLRYWGDHPRLETIAAAYFKLPRKKTPPPVTAANDDATPRRPLDWSLLDAQ
jgi:hypothetical protein